MRLKAVLALAAAGAVWGAVPTPKSHFGHEIGADRTVLDWNRVVAYFQALEQSSSRIKVEQIGNTAEGRPMIAAFISAADTIKELPRHVGIQKKLADPRITPQAELEPLISHGKAIVMITCSIHATE